MPGGDAVFIPLCGLHKAMVIPNVANFCCHWYENSCPKQQGTGWRATLSLLEIGIRALAKGEATIRGAPKVAGVRLPLGLMAPMTDELVTSRCWYIFIVWGAGGNRHG